jgi:hypothetical protein
MLCEGVLSSPFGIVGKIGQQAKEEMSKPDAFSFTLHAHRVQAVIPIASADEGQTARAELLQCQVQGAQTVFPKTVRRRVIYKKALSDQGQTSVSSR